MTKVNPHKYIKEINTEVKESIPPITKDKIEEIIKDNESINKLFFYEGKFNSKTKSKDIDDK